MKIPDTKSLFLFVFFSFLGVVSKASSITEEKFTFGTSTDTRLTVSATNDKEITLDDMEILKRFVDASANKQVGVISVTNQNLPLILERLRTIDSNFESEVRDYNGQPWILNSQAIKTMPKLSNGALNTVQTVLTIELPNGDVRVVFVKDNKASATNIGGLEDQSDKGVDSEETHRNAAIRELSEEVRLGDICRNKLEKLGSLQSSSKKPLLKLEWKEFINVYSCHLDASESSQWLQKMGFKMNDDPIQSYPVAIEEIQWIFIVKPEVLKNIEISLPLDAGKFAKLLPNHADYAAVVLNGKFKKGILAGRGVTGPLTGEIQLGDSKVKFGKQ